MGDLALSWQDQLAATINNAMNAAITVKVAQSTAPLYSPNTNVSTAPLAPAATAAPAFNLAANLPLLLVAGLGFYLLTRHK
jgi:hypothetical protein